eukprot:CAMPEP_0172520298 /NCGR_PEP_ID=MMETSP1066-20121228/291919_1 /TAXON_ID=671091 /ORGANISM="Coscinodiscus wailesii, Strain CCMP2513" /LENGTH=483 /DNA_ID=CAMNT_0013303031 /DNA_START=1433 /DNA_END=2885 /DNA_ORIENTATION=+
MKLKANNNTMTNNDAMNANVMTKATISDKDDNMLSNELSDTTNTIVDDDDKDGDTLRSESSATADTIVNDDKKDKDTLRNKSSASTTNMIVDDDNKVTNIVVMMKAAANNDNNDLATNVAKATVVDADMSGDKDECSTSLPDVTFPAASAHVMITDAHHNTLTTMSTDDNPSDKDANMVIHPANEVTSGMLTDNKDNAKSMTTDAKKTASKVMTCHNAAMDNKDEENIMHIKTATDDNGTIIDDNPEMMVDNNPFMRMYDHAAITANDEENIMHIKTTTDDNGTIIDDNPEMMVDNNPFMRMYDHTAITANDDDTWDNDIDHNVDAAISYLQKFHFGLDFAMLMIDDDKDDTWDNDNYHYDSNDDNNALVAATISNFQRFCFPTDFAMFIEMPMEAIMADCGVHVVIEGDSYALLLVVDPSSFKTKDVFSLEMPMEATLIVAEEPYQFFIILVLVRYQGIPFLPSTPKSPPCSHLWALEYFYE